MHLPLFHVDAFTNRPFSGNPPAVCLLDLWLDDGLLQKVAAENNLSATAFLVTRESSLDLRWFTPRCEVKLCGHATLAAAHVVFSLLQTQLEVVSFSTRFSGMLTAKKQGDLVAMDFPAFVPHSCTPRTEELPRALGIGHPPLEILEANETYIAVFDNPDLIRGIRPEFALLEQFHPRTVIATASGHDADFVSRYFAPSYGVPEDPVTGSAHSSLGPYWSKRLGKTTLHARQLSERGGELWCEVSGERVVLKGNAVLTLEGSLAI